MITSASSQTTSAAQKAAGTHGKSAGEGIFAKLLAIIEGKAKTDGSDGTEKLFKYSGNSATGAKPSLSEAKASVANPSPIEKSASRKIEAEKKDASDIVAADVSLAVSNNRHHPAKLVGKPLHPTGRTTNTSADIDNEKVADKSGPDVSKLPIAKVEETTVHAAATPTNDVDVTPTLTNTDAKQPAKGKGRPEAAHIVATAPAGMEKTVTQANTDTRSTAKTVNNSEAVHVAAAPSAGMEKPVAQVNTDTRQTVKTSDRSEAAHVVATTPAGMEKPVMQARAGIKNATGEKAEAVQASAAMPAEKEEIVSAANANQSAKTRGESGAIQIAAAKADESPLAKVKVMPEPAQNAAASEPGKTATPGKPSNPDQALKNEHRLIVNEKQVEGMKAAMQQATAISMQSEKGMLMQPEASLVAGTPEQLRLSTNHFMKSRRINLEHSSKTKNTDMPANTERKSEAPAGSPRLPSMQAAEAFAATMKDLTAKTDQAFRPAQQSLDLANGQPLQANSLEAASTLMRSAYQPIQSISSSGPWTVAAAMQQIGQAAGQGKFQLELTLTPEHLGKVQVFLDSDVNKQIQVHLVVDQATSRQSIEQHLPALRQALADQGLNMDSFSMASSDQGKENQQQPRHGHHLSSGATLANNQAGGEQRPQTIADSRLSIRI